jgi:hypothetical protein
VVWRGAARRFPRRRFLTRLLCAAVTQFYPAIEVIETTLGLRHDSPTDGASNESIDIAAPSLQDKSDSVIHYEPLLSGTAADSESIVDSSLSSSPTPASPGVHGQVLSAPVDSARDRGKADGAGAKKLSVLAHLLGTKKLTFWRRQLARVVLRMAVVCATAVLAALVPHLGLVSQTVCERSPRQCRVLSTGKGYSSK